MRITNGRNCSVPENRQNFNAQIIRENPVHTKKVDREAAVVREG
jgi:hypothetical protein